MFSLQPLWQFMPFGSRGTCRNVGAPPRRRESLEQLARRPRPLTTSLILWSASGSLVIQASQQASASAPCCEDLMRPACKAARFVRRPAPSWLDAATTNTFQSAQQPV